MTIHPKFIDAVKAMAAVNADRTIIDDILDNQDLLPRFGADTPKKIAHFLSQVGHESGGFTIAVEYMNYTAKRHMVVWPKRFWRFAPSLRPDLIFDRDSRWSRRLS
jgi:putative chitinase